MSLPVREILKLGEKQLLDAGIADAARDSKTLYCYMLDLPPARIILEYQNVLSDANCDKYFALIDRRSSGEPLQYITGSTEFMGLPFKVDPRVLIPRQDTEVLVEQALSVIKDGSLSGETFAVARREWSVLDLCCGSGAIGVSVAKLAPKTRVTLSDVSEGALALAKQNAEENGVGKNVKLEQGDLFAPFKGRFRSRRFDMILCNPPYIATEVIGTLQTEVKDHEPMSALDGGADGLDFYRRLAAEAGDHLEKGGVLMMEIGFDQGESVPALLRESGAFKDIRCLKDLAGLDRVVAARKASDRGGKK